MVRRQTFAQWLAIASAIVPSTGHAGNLDTPAPAAESMPPDEVARSRWYAPIFSDSHAIIRNSDRIETSSIQFGRTFTAGFSYTYFDGIDDPKSGGIFLNPDIPGESQLVLGTSIVDTADDTAFELQSKLTFASGFGFAGGYHRTGVSGQDDTVFVRIDYSLPIAGLQLNVAPLAQRNPDGDDHVDVGGYLRLTGPSMNLGYGFDGEEVRAVLNYVAPPLGAMRPAAEVLYVNSEVGDIDAGQFYLLTATASFSGGFFSPLYSAGRGAGPSAVYFPNPVSFTSATFNRLYDVWELGGQLNLRVEGFNLAGTRTTNYQMSLHPANFVAGEQGRLERLFLGFKHIQNDGLDVDDVDMPFVGYFGQLVGKLNAALVLGYDFEERRSEATLGFVYVH